MARITPFQALRYDPTRVRLSDVVTQPYDKITPAMQTRYYDASPDNLVRIILGRSQPDDGPQSNVYTRAAECFAEWRRSGVLRADPEPAIYAYTQRFAIPQAATAGAADAGAVERRGFIALGELEPYENRIVFRHEQTHSGPRADRLNLLRATRAHFGQLFMLYSDPEHRIETQLATSAEPDMAVTDEYGVEHRVWRFTNKHVIAGVQHEMAEKRLIIADGHHRYETALAYRDERRENVLSAIAGQSDAGETPIMGTGSFLWKPEWTAFERVMMTYVNMDSPGLLILPTHRLVFGLPGFDSGEFVRRARQFFSFEQIAGAPEGYRLAQRLGELRGEGTALVAITSYGAWLLRLLPQAAEPLLAKLAPRQRALDVAVLHSVLLQHVLGLSEEDIRTQKRVGYARDPDEAVTRVRANEADVAFLINPVSMEQVRDIAFAGEVLPQKSTDFYPKMLSGLTIYAMDA